MTLRGTTGEFPLETVLRLLADTKKTGELSIRGKDGEGALGIAEGRVVTAVYGDEQPIPALGAIFQISEAEFEFTPWTEAPQSNLEGDLQDNLRKAGEYREWLMSVRQVIPHDRVRFRLSERAAEAGAVTFTSDRWRVVLAVNGERDVTDMATHLHVDRDSTLTILAGLVRDGVIDAIDDAARAPAAGPTRAPAAPEPAPAPLALEPEPAPPVAVEPEPPPAPAEPEPPAPAFEAPPPAPAPEPVKESDWTAALLRDAAPSETAEPTAPPPPAPLEPTAPGPQEWGASEPAAPAREWKPPAQEWAPPAPAQPEPAPAPIDDRLAALFGAPAPAAEPAAPPADQWSTAATDKWSTPAPAADQWTTPAQSAEAPPAEADPRLGALTAMPQAEPATPTPMPSEWAPPETETPAPKKKGMFGRFKRDEAPEPATRTTLVDRTASSRAGLLAAFSNALLTEYNSGHYGKARVEDRIPSLLMRVDEQADPIDKPLPVVDDRLDVQALERISLPEAQAVPYLAMLVSTIYRDAEKAFGRDKAKRGYRAAQQHVFGGDTSALGGPDLAGKLPKI